MAFGFFIWCYLIVVVIFVNFSYAETGIGVDVMIDDEPTELILLHVVFRHGDRTPDKEEMKSYPNNPNFNNKFHPYGLRALKNRGKWREFQIGVYLRNTYDGFLDRIYIPDEIYVRSTDFDRSKMSALTCLAGLYPPENIQYWGNNMMWQPIPYHKMPIEDDDMLILFGPAVCPRFWEARLEVINTPEFLEKVDPFKCLLEETNIHVGTNLTSTLDIFLLDNLFQSEINYGLPTSEWAMPLIDKIKDATILEFELQNYNAEMRKLNGGPLIHKMITDSQYKINGTLNPSDRKLFMYSGHETNMAAVLAYCGVFKPHQPPYGSIFILELRRAKNTNIYGFRILYGKDLHKERPEVMPIPNCGEFCPVDKFVEIIKEVLTDTLKKDCLSK